MITQKFHELFYFGPKSKIKAGDGLKEGNFSFFTSSSILSKFTDKPQYYDDSIIFGTGGKASIHYSDGSFGTSTDCIVAITQTENINTKFVYYYLFGNLHILERGFKGAGLKHISKTYIENLDIPVLPIETQNKIVSILDKINLIVKKREQSINSLNELLSSIFLDKFGSLNKTKNKLDFLDNYSLKITDGTHQSPKFTDEGIPFLLVANIINNEIDYKTKKFITIKEYEKLNKRTPIEKGDILLTSVGSYGNPALVRDTIKFAFQRHIAYIKPNQKKINSIYLFEALKSDFVQFQIENAVRGIAQKTLNLSALKKIKIFVPKLSKQEEFALIAEKIYVKKIKLSDNLQELQNLFHSTIQKVFNGELNFNIDFELDALVREIDLQKKENDLSEIIGDQLYLQRLIDKLNNQEFIEKDIHDKAKHAVFQLLKNDVKVTQEYNEIKKNIKLIVK